MASKKVQIKVTTPLDKQEAEIKALKAQSDSMLDVVGRITKERDAAILRVREQEELLHRIYGTMDSVIHATDVKKSAETWVPPLLDELRPRFVKQVCERDHTTPMVSSGLYDDGVRRIQCGGCDKFVPVVRQAENRLPDPTKDLCPCGHPRADHRRAIGYSICGHLPCACTGIG